MNVRKFFSFLEHTFNHKKITMQKLQYKETAYAIVSSPNFVDPAIIAENEAKRLKDEPVVKNYEEVFQ